MELPTLRVMAALALIGLMPMQAAADTSQVTRNEQMISVRIGSETKVHTITLAAYRLLVNQGIPTTLIAMPKPRQRASGELMIKSAGWSVGVFR